MKAPKAGSVTDRLKITLKPDGGVNLSARPEEISDNQAAGLLNMWYDGNALRLRPGLVKIIEQQYGPVLDVFPKDGRKFLLKRISVGGQVTQEKYGVYIATQKAILSYDGSVFERVPCVAQYESGVWSYSYTDFNFSSCVFLPSGNMEYSNQDSSLTTWKAQGDSVYLFGSGYFLTIAPQVLCWPFPIGELHVTADYFVTYKQPYLPTLFRDTPPSGGGVSYEARNFLTKRASQLFTADSSGTVYQLCDKAIDNDNVTVDYLNPATGVAVTFAFEVDETSQTVSGITAILDRQKGTITFGTAPVGAAGTKNNIKVTFSKTVYKSVPVVNCSIGDWYGNFGEKNGGGSRIFLSGFQDNGNTVYYSAPDDPSYFPDDCVITVGDPADAVTGFGKQFGILIVLKEHSVYSVGSGSDAGFTLKPVHDGLGCDMPKSIQTVSNMLVFANTDGGLFMLHSTQIKDERTLKRLSRHVNPALLALPDQTLKSACAISTGRYYILFAGSQAFCLNCENDVLAGSSAELEDKLAFYIWSLPIKTGIALCLGGAVAAFSGDDNALYAFDSGATLDSSVWFNAFWHSKAFDFGQTEKLKKPSSLWIGFWGKEVVSVGAGCAQETCDTLQPVCLNFVQNDVQSEQYSLLKVPVSYAWSDSITVSVERMEGENAAFGFDKVILSAVTGAEKY